MNMKPGPMDENQIISFDINIECAERELCESKRSLEQAKDKLEKAREKLDDSLDQLCLEACNRDKLTDTNSELVTSRNGIKTQIDWLQEYGRKKDTERNIIEESCKSLKNKIHMMQADNIDRETEAWVVQQKIEFLKNTFNVNGHEEQGKQQRANAVADKWTEGCVMLGTAVGVYIGVKDILK
jgi:hypothetical protein